MTQRAPQWARWVASALALALTLAVASYALRPVPPEPEPAPPAPAPQEAASEAPAPAEPEPEPEADAQPQRLVVPSGQPVHLHEVIEDDVPGHLRFRFIAPELAQRGFEAAEDDIAHLCGTFALPWIEASEAVVELVVISLSERAIPFGESDPDTVQFFEGYRIEDGSCIWEQF